MSTAKQLTAAQKRFLLSYAVEFDGDLSAVKSETEMGSATRKEFLHFFEHADFDGAITSQEIRIAKNLLSKGILSNLEVHGTSVSQSLYVEFSPVGAQVLLDLVQGATS